MFDYILCIVCSEFYYKFPYIPSTFKLLGGRLETGYRLRRSASVIEMYKEYDTMKTNALNAVNKLAKYIIEINNEGVEKNIKMSMSKSYQYQRQRQ